MSCFAKDILKLSATIKFQFYCTFTFKSGDRYVEKRTLSEELVRSFIKISGDSNPIHLNLDPINAKFKKPVVHGALLNSLVSAAIGTKLPGPGSVVIKQELNFPSPCYVGEEIEIEINLEEVRKIIKVNYVCKTIDNKIVMHGFAKIMKARL